MRFARFVESRFLPPKQLLGDMLSSQIPWGTGAHMRLGKRLLID